MSLLMDALRRAEQEKKQQSSNRLEAELTVASTPAASPRPPAFSGSEDATLQVEPAAAAQANATARASLEATTARPIGPSAPGQVAGNNVDLGDDSQAFAVLDDVDLNRSLTLPHNLELEPLEDMSLEAEALALLRDRGQSDLTGGTTMGADARVEQTQTMPSTRALENDLNAYFDRSQSFEAPRAINRGDLTLEDVAQHTVVGAHTVFAAGEKPRSKRVLIGVTGVAAVLVLGIGVVGLYYAQQSPGPRHVPSPTVADGVERPLLRELPIVPLESPTSVTSNAPARVATSARTTAAPATASAVTASVSTAVESAPSASEFAETEVQFSAPAWSEPAARASDTLETASIQAPIAAAAPGLTAARPKPKSVAREPAQLAPDQDIGGGQLRIAKTLRPAAVDADVQLGYEAFKAGDLDSAARHYAAVLAVKPAQRDALLGQGAVALAHGDLGSAYSYYAMVLKQHPNDAVATAALLGLSGDQQGTSAARLRLMLDQHRDLPYLHFTLGTWYARQGRWGDAQQAYFDAMRLDADNADYAFNLAVSLDHIGQTSAALEYYRKSLSLVDSNGGTFNSSSVLARINELSSTAAAN